MVLPSRLQNLAEGWLRWVTLHPRTVLISALLVTLVAMAGGSRLELQMDGRAMVPPNDPVVLFDHEVRQVFGVRDPLVIVLESRHPEGIYHPDFLRRLSAYCSTAPWSPGISAPQRS